MARNTPDLIVERLLEWGMDTYFGLPKDGINGFFESPRQHRLSSVQRRQEKAAPGGGAVAWGLKRRLG